MVKFDLEPAPEEPSGSDNAKKEPDAGLENVINELRDVLSGLGSEKKDSDPETKQNVSEAEKAKTPPPPENPKPEVNTEEVIREQNPPSDAEFWSGNVLGWSQETPPSPVEEQPPEDWQKYPPEEAPSKIGESPPEPEQPREVKIEPPKIPGPKEKDRAFIVDSRDPSSPPEVAPPEEEKLVVNPLLGDEEAVGKNSISEPLEKPHLISPAASLIGSDIPTFPDAPVPIPGDIEQKIREGDVKDFELEEPEGAQKGRLQISCIYPEGQERSGQQFVFKLKWMGTKIAQPLTIESVYVQPWKADLLDLKAWCRASHLAGAVVIFILAAKKNKTLFEKLGSIAAEEGLKARLITLEQVSVRTLYADILDQLKRIAYGKD